MPSPELFSEDPYSHKTRASTMCHGPAALSMAGLAAKLCVLVSDSSTGV